MSKEPKATHARYGKFCENFLMARRLVEAGVSVVTCKVGDWDTHEKNFIDHKAQLPQLDQGFHALVTDLHDRGLDKDVAVVMWGEFGRAPEDLPRRRPRPLAGRGRGGGRRRRVQGGPGDRRDRRARRAVEGHAVHPGNVLATLYRHLGIDPAMTIPDHARRPMYVLDDREPVRELL